MTSNKPEASSLRHFNLSAAQAGKRLDQFLTEALAGDEAPTRSQVATWIEEGRVSVNGSQVMKSGFRLKEGAEVSIDVPSPRSLHLLPDPEVRFSVVHEEAEFLVINKPAGLVVHPGAGRDASTLVHGLLSHLGPNIRPIGDVFRPGLVHRLDKDTSGLMVVAKSEQSFRHLTRQLRPPRTMSRKYLLLAANVPRSKKGSRVETNGQSGVIELPIGRSPTGRVKMAVVFDGGREAKTFWRVKEALKSAVLCEVELETGRTHQIRVHFAAAHAAILGDPVYGDGRMAGFPPHLKRAIAALGRQALHAYSLSFLHPVTGDRVGFQAEIPADFQGLLEEFRKQE